VSWFPQVGDTVGRFRLTRVLGHGGMGVVFAAVTDDLEREVAVKVLVPHAATDPRLRERFGREAATLARLDSPHIVYILEHGEQDGCPYLVTQLVPDGDLRRHLEQHGPLTASRAAAVVAQVAAALEEAHAHGVVHRDLKSANVLLRILPDGELHAFLCDFGIAKGDSDETTSASGVLGTLEYLAPERQSGAPASVATDIYSLGCLLWAALTGAPPYRGSDVDIATAHLRAPVPQLPDGDRASLCANAIVARAMAKKPEDRYGSAREMREDLTALRALATEQELLADPSRTPRARRRAAVVALVGVAGVAVAATIASLTLALGDGGPDASTAVPTERPSSSAPTAATQPRRVRCWDGRVTRLTEKCSTPTGREGLEWVYPGFDRGVCRRTWRPLSPEKELGYFCPFTSANPREGIRYSEWSSAGAARDIISRDFAPWPEQEVAVQDDTWSVWIRESRDEAGWFSTALAYRVWPFSAEVVSNTPRATKLACNFVEQRAPTTFELVQSLCAAPELDGALGWGTSGR
jgi:serine/threonine-protein kinase